MLMYVRVGRCAGKKQSSGGAVPVNPAAVAHTTCTCGRLGTGDGDGRADCTCVVCAA